jgi:hypothetical protein
VNISPQQEADAAAVLAAVLEKQGASPEDARQAAAALMARTAAQMRQGKVPGVPGSGFDYSIPDELGGEPE